LLRFWRQDGRKEFSLSAKGSPSQFDQSGAQFGQVHEIAIACRRIFFAPGAFPAGGELLPPENNRVRTNGAARGSPVGRDPTPRLTPKLQISGLDGARKIAAYSARLRGALQVSSKNGKIPCSIDS
jgi:hypothetical protein